MGSGDFWTRRYRLFITYLFIFQELTILNPFLAVDLEKLKRKHSFIEDHRTNIHTAVFRYHPVVLLNSLESLGFRLITSCHDKGRNRSAWTMRKEFIWEPRFFVDCQLNGGVNGCFFVNAVEVNRVFSSTAASVELQVGSTAGPSSTRLGEAGWISTEGKQRPQTRSTVSSTASRFSVNGAWTL